MKRVGGKYSLALFLSENNLKLDKGVYKQKEVYRLHKKKESNDSLNIDIQMEEQEQAEEDAERITKAMKIHLAKKHEPTWDEIWVTGFTRPTGTFQKGIFQTKVTPRDKDRLLEVMQATEAGEIPMGVESIKKYNKSHALRMHRDLMLLRRDDTIDRLMSEIPDNYLLINEVYPFKKLIIDLWHEEEIAIDTETTGLNYFTTFEEEGNDIVGISLTLPKADYHVYIPFGHISAGKQLPEKYVIDGLKPVLENKGIKKILFNAKFDIHMLRRHGVKMGGFHFDAMIGMKLLNENEPSYSLKNLSTKYGKLFGFEDASQTYEELFGKGGFEGAEFERDGSRWIGTLYACKDTHLTYKFYKDFLSVHFDRLPRLKNLYYEIESPILEISVDMEQNGFLLDADYARDYAKELNEEVSEYREQLIEYFGDININSNQQLSKVLYDDLMLTDISKKRKVDAKTLKKLSFENEGVGILLKYRDLNKLLTTYIQPLPQKISKDDKRLHGELNQLGADTGRFSSRNPNLQNLPENARHVIIAPKRKTIWGVDFSQIEPRLLSHMSGDEALQDAYNQGRDLYTEMASKVFKLEEKYCVDGAESPCGTYQPRKRIKAVFLGIMYGMGSFTLSQNIQETVEVAEQYIEDFYETYPQVKKFVLDTHKFAEENEYVETLFGRKRRFEGHKTKSEQYHRIADEIKSILGYVPNMVWKEKALPYSLKRAMWDVSGSYHAVCRQAVNTRVQGGAADIMKLAMIAADKVCKKHGFLMLATIHDEILIETPEDITKEQIEEVEQAMLGVVKLDVPILVDSEVMYRWGKGIPKKDWFNGMKPEK